MNIHTLVTVSKNRDFSSIEKRLHVKVERDGERIAFSSYEKRFTGASFAQTQSFLIVGVDGDFPIRPDDYTAFGRIEGQEWVRAQHVDSI